LEDTGNPGRGIPKSITIALGVNFVPDTEMLEYACNENERDSTHLVGKASDEVKGDVKVSSQALLRYAGNYQATAPKMKAKISVNGEQPMFSLGGKGAAPSTTLSERASDAVRRFVRADGYRPPIKVLWNRLPSTGFRRLQMRNQVGDDGGRWMRRGGSQVLLPNEL
jgi:hypothetical protein